MDDDVERGLPQITPDALRAEARRRQAGSGYLHHGSVRSMMRQLASHMEAMAAFGSGIPDDAPLPSGDDQEADHG